jgi:5-hydroxyisourate hydrolase
VSLDITTHVLDTSLGRPARGVPVVLEREAAHGTWDLVGRGETDEDGRARSLVPPGAAASAGVYRLLFDTQRYFERSGTAAFYPAVVVLFEVRAATDHYHVPLLLSPFGYSTYRGS